MLVLDGAGRADTDQEADVFDDFEGLPLHPLVVHAPVVLIPLTALTALAFLVPRWRTALRWPLVVLAVLAAVSTYVAVQSGEALRRSLGGGGEIGTALDAHEEWGKRLLWVAIVLAVVAVLAAVVVRRGGVAASLLAVAVLVVGVVGTWVTYETGDRGARVVWCGQAVAEQKVDSLESCLKS